MKNVVDAAGKESLVFTGDKILVLHSMSEILLIYIFQWNSEVVLLLRLQCSTSDVTKSASKYSVLPQKTHTHTH